MPALPGPDTVAAVRRFNRFYTTRVGILDEGHLHSPFSLAAVRVFYELAHRRDATATELARDLALDPGYLSRILRDLAAHRYLSRRRSAADARRTILRLTKAGATRFLDLDGRASDAIATLLAPLADASQRRLVDAMRAIESVLGGDTAPGGGVGAPYMLRPQRPGDLGWIVQRHGAVYAMEYGWDERFEAIVAQVAADFLRHADPRRERCWIAERDGENVGSVLLVKHPDRDGVAKLRLLLVEPVARGLGIGQHLVDECVRFAWQAGYHTVTLWTNSILVAARRIYQAAGFQLVHEEPHNLFGHGLVEQTWELNARVTKRL